MAERYGDELAEALPEVDAVAGFGVSVNLTTKPASRTLFATDESVPSLDLLNLPRPPSQYPWAYVKVAEGCDKACGFCAIPSFRGPQRSRSMDSILAEVESLQAREVVLVAQDLAAYGRDAGVGDRSIVPLVQAISERVDWVRLLYLYPSELTDRADRAHGCGTGCRTSTSRCSTCRRRSCVACAAGATATSSSSASSEIRALRPRGRVPLELHRRLPR